jgi:hypothetical protein
MKRRSMHLAALLALAATVFVGTGVAAHFQSVPGAIARAFGFRGGIAAIDGIAAAACPSHGMPCEAPAGDGPSAPHDPSTCDTCTAIFLASFLPVAAIGPIGPGATIEIRDEQATGVQPAPAPLRALAARPPPVA